MKKLEFYTDGSCLDNQSRENYGGWAYVLVDANGEGTNVEMFGGAKNTTNNQMEMVAVIKALEWVSPVLREHTIVTIHSDSAYVVNCFKDEWYVGWRKNGWKNSKGKPVENKELWEAMLSLVEDYASVVFKKVAGHSGVGFNEKCDELCVRAAQNLKAQEENATQTVKEVTPAALPVYKTQGVPEFVPELPKLPKKPRLELLEMAKLQFAIDELRKSQLEISKHSGSASVTVTGDDLAEWLQALKDIIGITHTIC